MEEQALPPLGEIKFRCFTLSFPEDQEEIFRREQFRKSLNQVRIALLLAICFYGFFGVLDAWIFPGVKEELWLIRYGVFFPFAFAVYLFSFSRRFERLMHLCTSAVVLMGGMGVIFMVLIAPSPVNHAYYAGLILVSIFGYTIFRLPFVWATLAGWTILAAYEIGAVWLNATPMAVLINNNFFLVGANILGMFACYSMESSTRKEFMNRRLLEVEKQKVNAANQELERRVEERTKQLVRSNEKLKTEIIERRKAEEEVRRYNENLEEMVAKRTDDLAKSEERYRTILDNIADGYYEVDLAGNFTFFNDAVCEIEGYPREELMGMNNRSYSDRENAAKLYREYNKVYRTGIPTKSVDWEMTTRDGTKRQVETSVSLIRDPEGRPTGFRGILRDVTGRKQLEDELRDKKRLAEEASKAKSEFLANMSHEIRTPLNGIIGMTELAVDTGLDDNQKNIFHAINSEANSLFSLISDILDFSKIEAGKLELERIPFDLRVVVEDVANSIALGAEQKGLEFICFLSPEIPAKLIGDPGRLRQVLINLAGNAVKFTQEGEVYIRGEAVEESSDEISILFSVKDTGIGIPQDKQGKIFESFTQSDGSTTRKFGGTGLGTTISKQLVELMGGEIGLESEEGKGSCFRFRLAFEKNTAERASPAGENGDLSDLRVLVVDDNRTNRYIQMEYLRAWGCLPVEASSAQEALGILNASAASNSAFNLILTDVHMPEMDGFDLAREIRRRDDLSKVPIIVFTSAGSIGDDKKCKDIGIAGYLTKPIRRNEMYKAIVSVLGLSKREEKDSGLKLVTRHTIAEENRKGGDILLAEDYPTNQQVAIMHLQGAGYRVDLAENGEQAVEACRRKRYDLILMDIQMPVMEGYEATMAIRRFEEARLESGGGDPGERKVPIIAMTAHAMQGDRERCLEAGMDDYLAKPLRKRELLATVEKWIAPSPDQSSQEDRAPEEDEEGDRPIALERAVEEFEGDREFLMEVLGGFLAKVGDQIGAIEDALSGGDTETVWREAHAIKGGAANLNAGPISRAAFELEKAGRSGDRQGAVRFIELLKKEHRRLKSYAGRIS